MAGGVSQFDPQHLRGLVDMGSNGIRFSISSLQPPTQRIMPTLYQHRVGISLYDAQYSESGDRVPIDHQTTSAVISSFKQFRRTCREFEVPEEHITILATEATRTAVNSEDFRKQIKEQVGWDVTMLPKEEEGRVGAMGVASSLPEFKGLVMDLGGGSTQLSWLMKENSTGDLRMPESGAVSMPYGAAAMSRRLVESERNGTTYQLKQEIASAVKQAYATLSVPEELDKAAKEAGGFTLYLSGGGFRGWGYVLMSQHRINPYPIPVINGFRATRKEFLSTDQVKAAATASLEGGGEADMFRISERRAGQVPAVAMLINVLAEALPFIKEVRFCQGGVREGYLFSSLPPEVRSQYPLIVATRPFGSIKSSGRLVNLTRSALPESSIHGSMNSYENIFHPELLGAFANLIYYHASHSKDLRTTAALRTTTSGILASVHGVLHESRAIIALLLCARWGGSVPPSDEPFKRGLEQLVESPWILWWINYLGAIASLIASVYPAGFVPEREKMKLWATWGVTEKQRPLLVLRATVSGDIDGEVFAVEASAVEKVGKKKRWIGGRDGIGHKVSVEVSNAGG